MLFTFTILKKIIYGFIKEVGSRAFIKNRRTITVNLLWAVRPYSNMVWGSRNAEKKKKETISVWRFIEMNKICKVKVDDEIEWNHSAKAIFTWKINRNNYVNQIEASVLAPSNKMMNSLGKLNFVMCFNNPVSCVLPS